MTTTTTTVYYNIRQLIELSNNATVKLYSDKERKNVVGQAVYSQAAYNNFFSEDSWTQEYATFFLGDKDIISFDSSSFSQKGVLPAGEFTFTIIAGQGKYLGATGTVNFKVTPGGLRIITITAKLA